jgi:hypothetical protein
MAAASLVCVEAGSAQLDKGITFHVTAEELRREEMSLRCATVPRLKMLRRT